MPKRIQRKRTKGWRMPAGAVYVGRPSKWGNPFLLGDVVRAYPSLTLAMCHGFVVNQFRDMIASDRLRERRGYPGDEEIRAELAGRDLVCWCDPFESCHADVLLEIAAGGTGGG